MARKRKRRPTIHICLYSCLKTLASKHKCTISKVVEKFKDHNGEWGIPYKTTTGQKRCYFAKYSDCKDKANPTDIVFPT